MQVSSLIRLKPFERTDVKWLLPLVEKNRFQLKQWFAWVDYIHSEETACQYLESSLQAQEAMQARWYGIFYEEKAIGCIGIQDWQHDTRKAELGFWLDENWQRKGIMKEILTHFIPVVFDSLGLNKLEMRCLQMNKACIRLAQSCSFTPEALLRQVHVLHGQLYDVYVFGLLVNEMKNKHSVR